MADSELREVYTAADTQDAHFVKAVLEDAGISASVVGDHLQNAVGDLPFVAIAPRVLVWSDDFVKARDIVEAHEQMGRQPINAVGTVWKCAKCGETNDPSFEICWNCQAARDI